MSSKNIYSNLAELPEGTSKGTVTPGCLVLEGGAFRGLYTEGVLDAFLEADLNLKCTIGVSAGAMNGMNYVSGQIGKSARTNLTHRHDSRYVGLKAMRSNKGLIGFDYLYGELDQENPLDQERFYRPEQRFLAVATNCLTGESAFLEKGICSDIYQAVRASASMPYVSKMVMLDGIPYLDGGCSVNIPYQWAIDQDFEKIVIIRTRPDFWRYGKKSENAWAYRFYHSYPQFAKVLAGREMRYDRACEEINDLHSSGRVFVISPSEYIPVGRLEGDMEKLGALYHLGYQDGKNSLEKLKAYLA